MKKRVKKTWSAFGAHPTHAKITLLSLLFVAVSIPFAVIAVLGKTGLFSRASGLPVSSPLPPECKMGVNDFTVDQTCRQGAKKAHYVCYDGSEGNLTAKTCRRTDDFLQAAQSSCQKISDPVCGVPPTPTPVPTKGFGKAVKFNRSSYINIPASRSLLMGDNFLVEAWIKPGVTAITLNNPQYIVGRINPKEGRGEYSLVVSGGRVEFFLTLRDKNLSPLPVQYLQSKTKLKGGDWYFIKGVKTKNYFALFIDGVLEAKAPLSAPAFDTVPSRVTIGCGIVAGFKNGDHETCLGGFDGEIDEVRISSVLRENIIPSKPFVPDIATRALWRFNGDAKDVSREHNSGQIIGGVEFVSSTVPGQKTPPAGFDQAARLINNKNQTSYMKLKTIESRAAISYLAKNSGTVEAWVKLTKGAAGRVGILSQEGVGNFSLLPVRGGRYRLFFGSGQLGTAMGGAADNQLIVPGRWSHIALTREAGSGAVTLFLNGRKVGGGGKKMATKLAQLFSNLRKKENARPGTMIIGGRQLADGRVVNGFPGLIDELRLSSRVRYKDDFSVPKKPFSPDKDTLLLWHFDSSFREEVRESKPEPVGKIDFAPSLTPVWAL